MKKLYFGLVCFLLLLQVLPSFLILLGFLDFKILINGESEFRNNKVYDLSFVPFQVNGFSEIVEFDYNFYDNILKGTGSALLFESSDKLNEILFGSTYIEAYKNISSNNMDMYLPLMRIIWQLPIFIFIHIFMSFFFYIMSKFDPY